MKADFNAGVDSAVLLSPLINVSTSICMRFFYQITTSKISLNVRVSTQKNNRLKTVITLLYSDQTKPGSWNEAVVPLIDGVIRMAFVAVKTGATINRYYVAIDRISLAPYASCITAGHTCFELQLGSLKFSSFSFEFSGGFYRAQVK